MKSPTPQFLAKKKKAKKNKNDQKNWRTVLLYCAMEEVEDTWRYVIRGQIQGFGCCCFYGQGTLLRISKQNPIRIASKTLLPEAPFYSLGPQPNPIQSPNQSP